MAMNDSDIELLHAYLDGELPVAECEGLWRRLAIEKDLVEMAKARLQEFLLASFPEDRNIIRLFAIVSVKRVAASKISAEEIDFDIKKLLLHQLSEMQMDDLIPRVH